MRNIQYTWIVELMEYWIKDSTQSQKNMAFPWKNKNKRNLSIDIGTSSIKVLLTEGPIHESLKIFDYRYVHLTSETKRIKSSELAEILKQTLKSLDYDNENVRAVLSTKQNVVRIIQLPAGSNEEIKKTVSYQLGRHVPFSHENTIFDCAPLPDAVSETGTQKCMLVATRRSEVEFAKQIFEQAGIDPILLNTEPVSVINSFIAFKEKFDEELKINIEENDCVALVHFGASHTDLSILNGDFPVACRAIDFGYVDKAKKNDENEPVVNKGYALEKFISKTSSEINTLFKFCQRNFELDVKRIYISGGLANNSSVTNYLKEHSEVEVYRYNPFISANFEVADEKKEKFNDLLSAFVPLAGLAARNLNF